MIASMQSINPRIRAHQSINSIQRLQNIQSIKLALLGSIDWLIASLQVPTTTSVERSSFHAFQQAFLDRLILFFYRNIRCPYLLLIRWKTTRKTSQCLGIPYFVWKWKLLEAVWIRPFHGYWNSYRLLPVEALDQIEAILSQIFILIQRIPAWFGDIVTSPLMAREQLWQGCASPHHIKLDQY